MRLAAGDLAAALRGQPAVEEVIAWAAVASVAGVAGVVVGAAAEVGDRQTVNRNAKADSKNY